MTTLAEIVAIFRASDADATRGLYARLERKGPAGTIAANLLRAAKTSGRAKGYRRGARGHAYDTKTWAMGNVCVALDALADDGRRGIGVAGWGWGIDETQPFHRFVLYLELPTGQVSFHSALRSLGPDFAGQWDGQRNVQADRILRYAAAVLDGRPPVPGTLGADGSAIAPSRWLSDGVHLVCLPYTLPGLHDMAAQLGIDRCWFHGGTWPHYDLPKGRAREIADRPDVRLVGSKELLRAIRDDAGRQIADEPPARQAVLL
jgi:hypothetical protein